MAGGLEGVNEGLKGGSRADEVILGTGVRKEMEERVEVKDNSEGTKLFRFLLHSNLFNSSHTSNTTMFMSLSHLPHTPYPSFEPLLDSPTTQFPPLTTPPFSSQQHPVPKHPLSPRPPDTSFPSPPQSS